MIGKNSSARFLKWSKPFFIFITLAYIFYFIAVLIHGTLTDYQPEDIIPLEADQNSTTALIEDSTLSFVIWNLGYGGLGAESDFFYHNGNLLYASGQMVRSPKTLVERNIQATTDFIKGTEADFFLFQEVDQDSKRSYYINQYEAIKAQRPDYAAYFATNYASDRVPIPLIQPWKVYGKTYSGLASYSKYQPSEAKRFQLPGEFAWPTKIFQLDRCLLSQRYPLKNGKELIVLNLHNSAYDTDGALKQQQMAFLKEMVMKEYELGNYIVVGGDWNQCPPYFPFDSFSPGETGGHKQININPQFLPENWRWVYDPTTATNRKMNEPFDKETTFTTLIDFFLISPNVQVKNVRCIKQDFQYSDHQPVWMEVELL